MKQIFAALALTLLLAACAAGGPDGFNGFRGGGYGGGGPYDNGPRPTTGATYMG